MVIIPLFNILPFNKVEGEIEIICDETLAVNECGVCYTTWGGRREGEWGLFPLLQYHHAT